MTTPAPKPKPKGSGVISDRTANIITYAVTALWVLAQATGIITALFASLPDVQAPPEITGAFMLIVGGAFILRNKGKDDS